VPDFLVMPYKECDFLCPKEEFEASTMRVTENGRVKFGDLSLREVDLDGRLRTLFPEISPQNTGLSLVCRADRLFPSQENPFQDELVALRVGSESFVAPYAFSDFRLIPYLLRSKLMSHGIQAIRFVSEKVQYLIDLPAFLQDGRAGATL